MHERLSGPEEDVENEAVDRGPQNLRRDLANINALENNVYSLLLHKLNEIFVKNENNIALYFFTVWPSTSDCTFFNSRLPGPRASRDSRWLPAFNLTSMFPK